MADCVDMKIGTFYFLPYAIKNPFNNDYVIDCICYDGMKLILLDSSSYYIQQDGQMISLRESAFGKED